MPHMFCVLLVCWAGCYGATCIVLCIILVFFFYDRNICVCYSCVHHPAEYKGNDSFLGAANKRAQPRWCKPWFKRRPCLGEPGLTRNHFWVCMDWAARTSSASNSTHLSRTSNELSIWCWDTWKNQKIFVRSWLWEGSVCSCIFCKKVVLDCVDLFLSKCYCFAVVIHLSVLRYWFVYSLLLPLVFGGHSLHGVDPFQYHYFDLLWWLHWIRMKPHGWGVNFCALFMPGEIILCCCYWYFVSSRNQRAFTLQMDSDVHGDC